MTELFKEHEMRSDSPKLKWLDRYNIVTYEDQASFVICKWAAYKDDKDDKVGHGETETEALLDLIRLTGLPHWNA